MSNTNRNDIVVEEQTDIDMRLLNKNSIPQLVSNMLEDDLYHQLQNLLDENENYHQFNDLEMIYLFVHEKKDQDDEKNRTEKTKKEYLRELLWTYHVFINEGTDFDFDSINLDVYTLLKNVKKKHIRKYQEWLKDVPYGKGGKPYSVATISRKTTILKSFFSFLYEKQYIDEPIHQHFMSARVSDKDRPDRDLTADEAVQLLNYYKNHPIIYCFFSVLITTGARINELCTARICDLSYTEDGYWLKVIGKGNEEREVLIYPNVFDTIVEFRKRRRLDTILDSNDESPLFVTANHKPYTFKYLSNYLTKAIKRTDLPFVKTKGRFITPHTFRHGFAIISAEEGASLYQIMGALGHKQVQTTMIYLEKHRQRKNHAAHNWKNSFIIKSIK